MVEVKIDKGNMELSVNGSVTEVAADMLVILHRIYLRILEEDIISATKFRDLVETSIEEKVVFVDDEHLQTAVTNKVTSMLEELFGGDENE